VGVVLLNLDGLSDTLRLLRMNPQDQISIIDERNLFIAHTDRRRILEQDYERMELGTADQPREASNRDGHWLTATAPISGTNWTAVYYRDLYSARTVNEILLRQLFVALILGGMAAFAAALLLSYWIAAPFADLMVQTGEIAAGRYDRRLKSAYLSELDRLAAAFNKMADSIQKRGNALEWSLKEKDVLIQEIHHRVKNNLSVLVGLFGLAERKSPDAASIAFLEQMRRRVYAMASVHQLLYSSKDYSALDMAVYMDDIAASFFGEGNGHIRLELDCEHVRLPVSHAVPLGLLANELLTNCLKHAFPEGREGSVKVSLRTQQNLCRLVIADDGVGKEPGQETDSMASTGFELVNILAMQLEGTHRMEWGNGLRVVVEFPLPTGAQATQL
jgi:two-component sensor histidine kinase